MTKITLEDTIQLGWKLGFGAARMSDQIAFEVLGDFIPGKPLTRRQRAVRRIRGTRIELRYRIHHAVSALRGVDCE